MYTSLIIDAHFSLSNAFVLHVVCGGCGLTHSPTYHMNRTVVLQPAKRTPPNTSRNKSSKTQRTENKTTDVVIHQHSSKLLKMDILMSKTCWAHNKWNKIASIIKLVFHSSTFLQFWQSLVSCSQGPQNFKMVPPRHALYRDINFGWGKMKQRMLYWEGKKDR